MAEVPSLLNELKPIALFRLLVDFNTITSGEENRNLFLIEEFLKEQFYQAACFSREEVSTFTVVKVHSAILPQEG